jgi:flavin reductase (DIM6/NTAB) family NADH-FMN oxidoreductase RutF
VPLDEAAYRQAIAHFATGVTVVTTVADGRAAGMTASAVCSVSLAPVLLLVCVSNRLPTREALENSRRFAVNVLAEGDDHLARRFATPAADKFQGVRLSDRFDVPVLEDAMAYFICEVRERLPGGDHSIFIGEVTDCAFVAGRKPLLYFRSGFGRIEDADAYLMHELGSWERISWPKPDSPETL